MDDTDDYMDILDADLRVGKDRSDDLDKLFRLSFLGDTGVRVKVSWCVAKMAQNKVQDMRILDILVSMRDDTDPDVRENISWGIGEIAGFGICDDRSAETLLVFMSDDRSTIRGMAVWAVGRLRHKAGIEDARLISAAEMLLDDPSPLVRKSAEFALS